MDLLYIILVIATVFVLGVLFLDKQTDYLPESIGVSGPVILLHSKVGFQLVERIAEYKQFWKRAGTLGVLFCFIGMVLASFGIGTSAISVLFRPEQTQVTQPKNYLAIPGVNDFLPMSVAIEILLALVIGVIIHEGAHAVLCRVEGIELKSTGLVFLSFIPMGAFVEPIEESKMNASRVGRMRMASAGILSNLALTFVSVILVVLIASTLITTAPGAAVGSMYDGSPAAQSSLPTESVITSVNGQSIESNEEFTAYLANSTAPTLTITTKSGETYTIKRNVFISGVQNSFVNAGTTIQSINGQSISTVPELKSIAHQQEMMTLQTTNSKQVILPAGPQVKLTIEDSSKIVYITAIEGQRVVTLTELQTALSKVKTSSISVVYYTDTNAGFEKHSTTIQKSQLTQVYQGVAGITFRDTGIVLYPAQEFLSVLRFDSTVQSVGILQLIVLWFVLPLGKMIPGLHFNFPGFTPMNTNFYQVTLGTGIIEGFIFFSATAFFWMAWMNFNLALFNCLPIWALDGNHVLRDGLQELDARIDNTKATPILKSLEYGIPLLALLMFIVILLAPVIVSML